MDTVVLLRPAWRLAGQAASLLALLTALAAGAHAQAPPGASPGAARVEATFTPSAETVEVGGIEWPAELNGTLVYTYDEAYPGAGAPYGPACEETSWTATMNVRLGYRDTYVVGTAYDAAEGTWTVTGSCFGTQSWEMGDDEVCTQTMRGTDEGVGTFPSEWSNVTVILKDSAKVDLGFALEGGTRTLAHEIACSVGGGSDEWVFDWSWGAAHPNYATGSWTGEGDSLSVTLNGSAPWEYGEAMPWTSRGTWSGGFGPRALELVVERSKAYDEWIPNATDDEQEPGPDGLFLRARLAFSDGQPSDLEAESFTFELVDVSREPGVAMNWPPEADATRARDLGFDAVHNVPNTVTAEGQRLETVEGGTEATAVVSSYDWGAAGYLRVTAHMPGGWTLTGYLEGDEETTVIPVPMRAKSSRIADAWLDAHGMRGRADSYDGEDRPVGDRHTGDGLALYEEYRGFYENGRHINGDVERKDLFLFDEVGGPTKKGIALFAAATELAVHHEFTQLEHADRRINFNVGDGAHVVAQHGLRIILLPEARGAAQAAAVDPDDGPDTPGKIRAVEIPPNILPGHVLGPTGSTRAYAEQYYAATVAHEIGHGTHLWHHGIIDKREVAWRVMQDEEGNHLRDAAGNLRLEEVPAGGRSTEIRVLTEGHNAPLVLRVLQRHGAISISQRGEPGGEHSGDENCFMRYDLSPAYRSKTDPVLRYWTGPASERVGLRLCSRPEGTGVNDAGRKPESRYGDASFGDCVHQICVNDLYHHSNVAP